MYICPFIPLELNYISYTCLYNNYSLPLILVLPLQYLALNTKGGFCSTTVIIKENIYTGFRSARLVLYNLEAVILKLNIVLCILTLLKLEDTL
jgi:hypothetical protein